MIFATVVRKIARYIKLLKVSLYSYKVLEPFDETWFKGKRVAIVGGGDSVLHEKLGKYIDDFDVVVRVNKGVEIIDQQYEFVGRRTDVLFHSFYMRNNDITTSPIAIDLWKKNNVIKLIFAHNYFCSDYSMQNLLYFLSISKKQYLFSQVPKQMFYENHKAVYPANGPTTGFVAINTVFNCQPKELYITGFTFSKTPNNKLYRDITREQLDKMWAINKAHDVELEYTYVKNIYYNNKDIVKVDTILSHIFLSET